MLPRVRPMRLRLEKKPFGYPVSFRQAVNQLSQRIFGVAKG
jgi:hypothetical protein